LNFSTQGILLLEAIAEAKYQGVLSEIEAGEMKLNFGETIEDIGYNLKLLGKIRNLKLKKLG
jgi:hypothetical protein